MFRLALAPSVPKISPQHRLSWCLCALIGGVLLSDLIIFDFLSLWWIAAVCAAGFFASAFPAQRIIPVLVPVLILAGWVCAGISVSGYEMSFRANMQPLTVSRAGQFSLAIEQMSLRPSSALRLEGPVVADSQTDPDFAQLNRIRVSLRSWPETLKIGDIITARGRLFPLSATGFANSPDFARHQWLRGIDATGFSWRIIDHRPASPAHLASHLAAYRQVISSRISEVMASPEGGIASAMLVGIRDRIPETVYQSFRLSGLAHLLAISGLHMSIFCFAVLAAVRFGFALFPAYAMRFPVHKLAAVVSLGAGFLYLCLTGFPISAVRAFFMAALVILALLTDRLAFTFRNLALVGLGVVTVSPSSVYTASFQLSFIASFALVLILSVSFIQHQQNVIIRTLIFLMTSSAVIVVVSAPYTAWHFGSVALWGPVANLFAIPLTGFVVMPLGVWVLISSLFGEPVLSGAVMSAALSLLVLIAEVFSHLSVDGLHVTPPEAPVLFLFLVCLLTAVSVTGFCRIAGMLGMCAILVSLCLPPRYDAALFMQSGKVVIMFHHRQGSDFHPASRQDILSETGSEAQRAYWLSNAGISDYFTYHLERHFGHGSQLALDCSDVLCIHGIHQKQIGTLTMRSGLTPGCRMKLDFLITPFMPRYPCTGPGQVVILPLENETRYLIRISEDAIEAHSNRPGHTDKPWRQQR